jgi:membrane protease YdiL (CAAX protease family)
VITIQTEQGIASSKFGEKKGPFVVWLVFSLYLALLVTVLAPFIAVRKLTIVNLAIQSAEVYGAFLVFFLALKEKRRSFRDIFSSVGLKRSGTVRSVLWSLALFPLFAVIGLMSMMLVYFLGPSSASASSSSQVPAWYFWYAIIQSFFPVAVVEEMIGRGYMLDRLMPQHPLSIAKALPAIHVSSLLFTLYHVPSYLVGYAFSIPRTVILLSVNVFPYSVLLSVAYVRARTRNIIGPVLIHFLLDALPVILMLASTARA